MKYGAED